MKLKNLAKKSIMLNHKLANPTKCRSCSMHVVNPNGRIMCSVYDDYVDEWNYNCPKEDGQHRYCEKYKTYCWKENTCEYCPLE